ncbi:UPF0545 protein C22orf39 homolog isoform X1 [Balaenoptera ricei]|uniref:UPF0545 protein C22orf39 homolog isoform X1 n=1 Tax=Balaenoptera ricei TaxID=2746895 RepID=UPI0028BD91B4|nr:UPF0545 protein C22orf39 homolog isoform X1 [Balaenoptera ricei]
MAEGGGWQPPRPCEAYRAEWELCSSAGHFLRHYYVHGERPACGQWRRDLDSCREWEERRSAEAQEIRTQTQRDDHVGTREDGRLHAKERGLGRNQPCRHLDHGHPASGTERNKCELFQPLGLWCFDPVPELTHTLPAPD